MASFDISLKTDLNIRDTTKDESMIIKDTTNITGKEYYRDRLTLSGGVSGQVFSFQPTSGIGFLKIMANKEMNFQLNQSGIQFGARADAPFILVTDGAGKNLKDEITSLKLYNGDNDNPVDLDIIHTD